MTVLLMGFAAHIIFLYFNLIENKCACATCFSDPELLYDQAVGEYQNGHLEVALALFEKAHVLKSSLYNGFGNVLG